MRIGLFILIATIAMNCGSDASLQEGSKEYKLKSDLQPLHDEVMAIHDEMMPKLSVITEFQTHLREEMDSMRGMPELKTQMLRSNSVLADLNRAEDAMWSWMHGFSGLDTIAPDQQESWLRHELYKVQQMKDIMLSGIEKAQKHLNE